MSNCADKVNVFRQLESAKAFQFLFQNQRRPFLLFSNLIWREEKSFRDSVVWSHSLADSEIFLFKIAIRKTVFQEWFCIKWSQRLGQHLIITYYTLKRIFEMHSKVLFWPILGNLKITLMRFQRQTRTKRIGETCYLVAVSIGLDILPCCCCWYLEINCSTADLFLFQQPPLQLFPPP